MEYSIKEQANKLRLSYVRDNIDLFIKQATEEQMDYEQFISILFQHELELRNHNTIIKKTRAAKFPYVKQLENLEVDKLPEDAQKYYNRLKTLDFINDCQNIILAGNPGTGKTHLAIGLGVKACKAGYNVYFAHVPSLIIELKEARNSLSFQRLKYRFEKYQLIILDELGYISFDKEGAELLFNFLTVRCEKASTIFTTNLPFTRWNEIFHDPVITAAIVDRITHQSYVINMNGNSYRMLQTQELIKEIEC